jgi:hypothetical protein
MKIVKIRVFRRRSERLQDARSVLVSAFAIAALFGTCAHAQVEPATISGIVTDPGGEAVPAIPVQWKDASSGQMYTATTSKSGGYVLTGLPAGSFDVSVPAVGFTLERFEKKGLVLRTGEKLRLDISMVWAGNLGTPGDDPSIYLRSKYARTDGPVPRMPDGKPDLSGVWNGNDDRNPQDPEALPAAALWRNSRWEGDTLVVDTVGLNNKSWLGEYSHTEQLHVIERYTRRDLGHMEVQVVMEDPGTFLKTWTVNMIWNLAPGEEMMEYVCTENNRDVTHLVAK